MTNTSRQRRYRAFMSYSHKDKAVASRLFRRLDSYRTPKGLVGPTGDPVPGKLYPIFRDREELPTANDLSDKIRSALAQSDHLIVICSPEAADSEWVSREIEMFAELGGADRIHAIIASGAPPACIPAALRALRPEMLAADLQAHADGWSLAPIKLTAGILGVSVGELQNRELLRARQRSRLLAALVATFVFLTVAAGGGAAMAWQNAQSREAMLIQSIALTSGIVDRAVEMRDYVPRRMVQGLLEQAESGYRGLLRREKNNDKLQYEYSRLLVEIARHRGTLGDTAGWLKSAEEGAAIAAALLARTPNSQSAKHLWASTQMELGDAKRARGRIAEAEAHYRAVAAGRSSAGHAALRPQTGTVPSAPAPVQAPVVLDDKAVRRFILAGSYTAALASLSPSYGATACLSVADALEAEDSTFPSTSTESAQEIEERLHWQRIRSSPTFEAINSYLRKFPNGPHVNEVTALQSCLRTVPEDKSEADGRIANMSPTRSINVAPPDARQPELLQIAAHVKLGDALADQLDLDGAMAEYDAAERPLRVMLSQPRVSASAIADLTAVLVKKGDIHRAAGAPRLALQSYIEARSMAQRLASRASDNREWRTYHAVTLARSGLAYVALGDPSNAWAMTSESERAYRQLVAFDEQNRSWQRDLATTIGALGDICLLRNDFDCAELRYEEALNIVTALVAFDSVNTVWRRDLAFAHIRLAAVAEARRNYTSALGHYRAAEDVLRRRSDSGADSKWTAQLRFVRGRVSVLSSTGSPKR